MDLEVNNPTDNHISTVIFLGICLYVQANALKYFYEDCGTSSVFHVLLK